MAEYPMAAGDALWLDIERPEQSTSVDGAFLFLDQLDLAEVRALVQDRMVDRFPGFRRRPHLADDGWRWEDDESFDLKAHVFQVKLEDPTMEGLRNYISRERSTLLSRTHPMWSIRVINDISGMGEAGDLTGSVLHCRWHHSIADGIRLVQLMLALCEVDAEASVPNVGKPLGGSGTTSRMAGAVRETAKGMQDVAASIVTRTNSLAATLAGRGGEVLTQPHRLADAALAATAVDNRLANTLGSMVKLTVPGRTSRSVWAGDPGPIKESYWTKRLPIDSLRAIRNKHPQSSINDIMLAIFAGALTAYMREHGDTETRSTGWFIPASIKPLDQNLPETLGNHFVGLIAELPANIDDPAELLSHMTKQMTRIKNSDEAFIAFGLQQEVVGRLPRSMRGSLLQSMFDKVNGTLSSVPGPRGPMTLAGHHVDQVLAFSPTVGQAPIVVTFFSYNGSVTIAMSLDRKLLPDGQRLAELVWEQAERMIEELS